MQIICPDCQFTREVDETKLPARSQMATCPKCKTKFRFRELPKEKSTLEDTPDAAPVAEPVPEPEPVVAPTPAQPEPTFPKITAPGEDPKEELWDKLGDMAPPEGNQSEQPAPTSDQQAKSDDQQPVADWTGDFPDPMQDDFIEEEKKEAPMLIPPPFEQLDRYGFFHGLYMTIKLVLTSPRLFFSVMPVGGGLSKPLTFAILVTMIQALAQLIWGATGLTPGLEINNQEIFIVPFNVASGIFELLFAPAVVAVTLFIVTGFYHLFLIIMKADRQGFEGSFRAVAYGYAPIVTGIFPMPSIEIMGIWMFVYATGVLVLTAIGLKYVHGTSYTKTIAATVLAILTIGMIGALAMFQTQLPAI